MGILDGTRSRAGGRDKRGLVERLERYFGNSASMKSVVCLGAVASLIVASLLLAIFLNASMSGGEADPGANASAAVNNGSTIVSPSASPMNSSEMANVSIVNGSTPYSEVTDQRNVTETFNNAYPSPTPTTVPKLPLEILWDVPFNESVKPIENYDRQKLIVSDVNYRFDNGTLLIDPAGTYGGSVYAYAGDTIGMRLRIYNYGKVLDDVVGVDISLLKMTDEKLHIYTGTGVNLHYDMSTYLDERTSMEKNITISVPDESLRSPGCYRLCVNLYVNGTLSSDMSKDFNVL